jgi:hypothetical protein
MPKHVLDMRLEHNGPPFGIRNSYDHDAIILKVTVHIVESLALIVHMLQCRTEDDYLEAAAKRKRFNISKVDAGVSRFNQIQAC